MVHAKNCETVSTYVAQNPSESRICPSLRTRVVVALLEIVASVGQSGMNTASHSKLLCREIHDCHSSSNRGILAIKTQKQSLLNVPYTTSKRRRI